MDRQINIEIKDRAGWTKEFNELTQLLSFLESEAGFWKKEHEAINKGKGQIHQHIEYFSEIERTISEIKHDSDDSSLNDDDFKRFMQNRLSRLKDNWLCSDNSCSAVFIDCNKQHGMHAAEALINFIADKKIESLHYDHFVGTLAAYEFVYQGSDVLNRKAKIQELENLYQEKLRLQKPAEYWKKSANKFSWHGLFWTILLLVSLAGGIYFLYELYIDWFEDPKKMKLQLDTIQGVVIFGTLLAVYIFLIRVLSRLAFSAFHLMRDAEEREQLTYLYLSLINEKKIDEKSRDIILQALFSRSETGLLTGASAPAMPSVGMSEIVNPKQS